MTLEIATPGSVIVTGGRRHGVALNHVKLVSPNFVVTELGTAFRFLFFSQELYQTHCLLRLFSIAAALLMAKSSLSEELLESAFPAAKFLFSIMDAHGAMRLIFSFQGSIRQ